MEKTIEVYAVPKCPVCGQAHKYGLSVLRSSFLYGSSAGSAEKRIRRLFTCPTKEEDFEGVVTLQDDPNNKISSVTVTGLVKEEK